MKWICIKEYEICQPNDIVYVATNKNEFIELQSKKYLVDFIRINRGTLLSGMSSDGTLRETVLFSDKDFSLCGLCMEDFNEHFQSLAEYRNQRIDEILND